MVSYIYMNRFAHYVPPSYRFTGEDGQRLSLSPVRSRVYVALLYETDSVQLRIQRQVAIPLSILPVL